MVNAQTAGQLLIEAYKKIAEPNEYVRIYDVWAEVIKIDMSHEELTEGCKWIARNVESASVANNSYPPLRTPEEVQYPVIFAGQERHLIGMTY